MKDRSDLGRARRFTPTKVRPVASQRRPCRRELGRSRNEKFLMPWIAPSRCCRRVLPQGTAASCRAECGTCRSQSN